MNFPYPFFPVQYTKDAQVFQPSEVQALLAALQGATPPTDLFLMCHGWNNNMDDAKTLYSGLAGVLETQIKANPALTQRSYAICGVLWPSKKFEDSDLIPSGAASLNDAVTVMDLKERVRQLKSLYDASDWSTQPPDANSAVFDEMTALMEQIEDDPAAQDKVVALLRKVLPAGSETADDASDKFFKLKPKSLVEHLSRPLDPPVNAPGGGASVLGSADAEETGGAGSAAGMRDLLGGVKSGFLHLLNFGTYYLMKARAGSVGEKGIEPLVEKIRAANSKVRLHLIGHSFGCRAVTAAVNAIPNGKSDLRPDTMMLLQGAFSHNGFALAGDQTKEGVFRPVIAGKKVRGPILISHTRNDKAVGIAYPIASRLSGVTAAALGDENDIYGGLGSNGAQTADTTPERVAGTLLGVGATYPWAKAVKASVPYNLKADEFIKSHSDIVKPEAAYALTIAMTAPIEQVAGKG